MDSCMLVTTGELSYAIPCKQVCKTQLGRSRGCCCDLVAIEVLAIPGGSSATGVAFSVLPNWGPECRPAVPISARPWPQLPQRGLPPWLRCFSHESNRERHVCHPKSWGLKHRPSEGVWHVPTLLSIELKCFPLFVYPRKQRSRNADYYMKGHTASQR